MAIDLPTGIVTFFFTDIEESTQLAKRMGIEFGGILEAHFGLIRQEVVRNSGLEVNTTGDGLFAVFKQASSAIAAAIGVRKAFQIMIGRSALLSRSG